MTDAVAGSGSDPGGGARSAGAATGAGSEPGCAPRSGRGGTGAAIAVGVDIGGTHLRAALVTADGTLLEPVRKQTPARAPESLVDDLVRVIQGFDGELPVGIGIAGLVQIDGTVRYGPNIGIRDLPLASLLEARTGRPIVVLNDGSAATFAEQRVGAARGNRDVVMFTLGTGVGGGITQGGELVLGSSGFAGEIGHVIVAEGGRPCPCGNRGCIEAYASGTAIGAVARERLETTTDASLLRDHGSLDGRAVSDAAAVGDAVAQATLHEAGRWLGVAGAAVVNLLDPQIMLVGGGAAAGASTWMLPAARDAMRRRVVGQAYRDLPSMELAVLGDDAGTVGAGLYAASMITSRQGHG